MIQKVIVASWESSFPFDSFPLHGQSLRAGSRLRRSFALRIIFLLGMTVCRDGILAWSCDGIVPRSRRVMALRNLVIQNVPYRTWGCTAARIGTS
jgi:hypothetical protein